jgi:hypothetical protein
MRPQHVRELDASGGRRGRRADLSGSCWSHPSNLRSGSFGRGHDGPQRRVVVSPCRAWWLHVDSRDRRTGCLGGRRRGPGRCGAGPRRRRRRRSDHRRRLLLHGLHARANVVRFRWRCNLYTRARRLLDVRRSVRVRHAPELQGRCGRSGVRVQPGLDLCGGRNHVRGRIDSVVVRTGPSRVLL